MKSTIVVAAGREASGRANHWMNQRERPEGSRPFG